MNKVGDLLGAEGKNEKNEKKALWLLETRAKNKKNEKKALRFVVGEGKKQEK